MHPPESTAKSPEMVGQGSGVLRRHVGGTASGQFSRTSQETFIDTRHSTERSEIHQTTGIPNRTRRMSAKDELRGNDFARMALFAREIRGITAVAALDW